MSCLIGNVFPQNGIIASLFLVTSSRNWKRLPSEDSLLSSVISTCLYLRNSILVEQENLDFKIGMWVFFALPKQFKPIAAWGRRRWSEATVSPWIQAAAIPCNNWQRTLLLRHCFRCQLGRINYVDILKLCLQQRNLLFQGTACSILVWS